MTTYLLSRPQTRRDGVVWGFLLVFGAFYLGQQLVSGGPMLRRIFAVALMIVLAIPALKKPRIAVQWLFVLLPFLGMVRHMFLSASGAAVLDPLLLVTSVVAIMIFVSLVLSGDMQWGGTFLAKLVFLLLLTGLLQVFNPSQGQGASAILVGITGIMINVIPIAFFFIGRSVSDAESTHRMMRIVIGIGTVAAVYGLVQVFIGFRGFELEWLRTQGYTAATVGATTRPFSFFNNASEWASYAHLAFVAALSWFLFSKRSKRAFALVAVAVIGYSGFLTGSRGFTVKIVFAIIVLLAARARNRALAAGIVACLVSGVVLWSATTSSQSTIQEKEAGASQLVEQQIRALSDPFNRQKSTLPIHFEQAAESITYAITHQPLGLGTGAPTRAGAKFQGGVQASSELDIGDAFLAYGIFGGGLYVLIIVAAVRQASRVRRSLPGPVWIGIWAMAMTSIGAWMVGGNYSIGPLIWFMIGASDAAYKRMRDRGLLQDGLKV
jgi:Co/Zn/Cd efflux system component